jgi:hypothetical protein
MRTLPNIIFVVGLFLIGCGQGPHSAYVGVWQSLDSTPKTFELSKDGETFLLQDLRDYDGQGKLRAPMVLSKDGDQLVVKTGFGQVALGLTESGKKLNFDRWSLAKVSPSEAPQVKEAIRIQFAKRMKARTDCAALGKTFEERERVINQSSVPGSSKLAQLSALRAEKIAKASEIDDCKRQLMIF